MKYQKVLEHIKSDKKVCEIVAKINNVHPYGTSNLSVFWGLLSKKREKNQEIKIPDFVDIEIINAIGSPYISDTLVNELIPFFAVKGTRKRQVKMVSDSIRQINDEFIPTSRVVITSKDHSDNKVLINEINDNIIYAEFKVQKQNDFFPFVVSFFFFFDDKNEIVKVIQSTSSW